jgi:hypothetical protein
MSVRSLDHLLCSVHVAELLCEHARPHRYETVEEMYGSTAGAINGCADNAGHVTRGIDDERRP